MKTKCRLVWLSDLHFNFLRDADDVWNFGRFVRAKRPDAVVITGDIGTATTVRDYLVLLAYSIDRPIYFTLGNHDYYHGDFASVIASFRESGSRRCPIVHLDNQEIIRLGDDTALIGHGGWGDGVLGSSSKSSVRLTDYEAIRDLRYMPRPVLFEYLRHLGEVSAAYFQSIAPAAFAAANHVVCATHVPPFPEACRGRSGEQEYLPFYCNRALGKAILFVARRYPKKQLTILCGHTHTKAKFSPAPNVTVRVAPAEYGKPGIAGILNL